MGSDQQFCLRWNNFQSSLLASLPQLLDADDLTDVTLSAGGRNIRAHRVVLSACSQYFKDLFREMQSFQHPVIVLPQTTFSDLCSLVTFMYSGEVNIYQDQLAGLLSTADVLHIRGLAEVPHANGTPLKRKVEENVHQDPATSSHILQKRKISELPPSMTVNETPAHNPMGKLNRIEKPGKPLMGKKRSMERDEMEDLEQPPFVQVKVEQCVEAEVESPVQHTRPKPYLHHHSAPTLHAVQPMPPEKQCHAPRGGDSYALPHPVEDAIGMEGEAGYPEGNQVPVSTDAALQGQSSSEDSGGGGNGSGGGNTTELEHQNLGQGMIIIPSHHIPSSRQSTNCPVCGRFITQRRSLKSHMRIHAKQAEVGLESSRVSSVLGTTVKQSSCQLSSVVPSSGPYGVSKLGDPVGFETGSQESWVRPDCRLENDERDGLLDDYCKSSNGV
ncbi:protein bric-a-brac 2-like isoform X2 [Ischnura elegans]|uniref:protein bric-a-brac 2-like isoform X2 n=1 Tax=Ischnura elegans TaxID=197161 RepID=UPI001ED89F24|nr:protein bric-a-brac 2-like isoform X2 [Ischnura elegans]